MFSTNLIVISSVLFVCLPNALYSITNQPSANNQHFITSPLIPSKPADLNRFLLFVNNPQLRQRENRFKDSLRENLRENLNRDKNFDDFKILEQKEYKVIVEEKPERENRHHNNNNNNHHRDQRRVRIESNNNLFDSNRTGEATVDNQQQWLPEQV